MGKKTSRALLAASLVIAAPAGAQTAAEATEPAEEIIVTGARAPIEAGRIGSAATIITRDDIERSQARYLADVLRAVPGLAISYSGGIGSQTQARARGGEANHILVLIDGIRANDPASGDEFRFEHVSTGNVQRIEIVRGPQSALWGSDAIDAVVNVVTRSAADNSTADAYAEGGSNGTMNAGLNATGNLADWNLTGAIESLDTDGTNISRTGRETDGADLATASLAVSHESRNGASFGASIRATENTTEFDPVDFIATGLPTDGNLESQSDYLIGSVGAAFATNADGIEWQLRANHFDSQHRNFTDGAEDSSTAATRVTYMVQTDIALNDNALSVALEHADTDFEQRGAVAFGDPNQDQNMRATSAIAEYRRLAGERLTWIVSARYDSYTDFDDALTGKLSIAYQRTDSMRLRAGIGTGQKTPTFIERFGFFPEQFVGNPALEPESSLAYDVGVDRTWRDGTVSMSASLYSQKLDDEIDGFVFDPATSLFTAANLAGSSSRRGVELTTRWRASDVLSLGASYTYTDATEENSQGQSLRELRRPRHSGNLSLALRPAGQRFEAIVVAEYGGKRDDRFFPPFPEPSRRLTLSDYWLVDATAQFRLTPSIALFARGTNLLDEDYEQIYGFSTLDRAIYVGVRVDLAR